VNLNSPLVTTQWLHDNLKDEQLRVYDTSIFLSKRDDGFGYVANSGRDEWSTAHVPGAGFLDLSGNLSDLSSEFSFTMPPVDVFRQTMADHGVNDDSVVILYNKGFPMWSTRVWWMLRSVGFDRAAVLDGGWEKWKTEGRPVTDTGCRYPRGKFTANPRPGCWVDKHEMLDMVRSSDTTILNALSPKVFSGEVNQYGRAGHLPGTHNVFYGDLVEEDTREFVSHDRLEELLDKSGALQADRVVTYCGGGISATMDALALVLCGQHNIGVYDGSMSEWVKDDTLPLKLGNEP
jgi:thiosulfate/3-mercaptopyruvate sulfurtransferase